MEIDDLEAQLGVKVPILRQLQNLNDDKKADQVDIFADLISFDNIYARNALVKFSESSVRAKGLDVCLDRDDFDVQLKLDDIVSIESIWFERTQTAMVKIRVISEGSVEMDCDQSISDIKELNFAATKIDWINMREDILSLNPRYNTKWTSSIDSVPEGDHDAVSMDVDLKEPDTWIKLVSEDLESEANHQIKSIIYVAETTGTTVIAVLGLGFVIGCTDGRRVETYFGRITNDSAVKTYWLYDDMYAVSAGNANLILEVSERVMIGCIANHPTSVKEIAERITGDLNNHLQESTCSLAVMGRIQGVDTALQLYKVEKAEAGLYVWEPCIMAICGSGGQYVDKYLNKFGKHPRRLLNSYMRDGNVNGAKRILKDAICFARRWDVHTDGMIYMTTITNLQQEPLFEASPPLDWLYPYSSYHDWEETFTPRHMDHN